MELSARPIAPHRIATDDDKDARVRPSERMGWYPLSIPILSEKIQEVQKLARFR